MTAWKDQGENVEVAAMSPRVVRLLRDFESARPRPCEHGGPQVAAVTDLRSMCATCAASSYAFRAWTGRGPCSACGALPGQPPALVWLVPSRSATVAVRLCPDCQADLTEPESEGDDR